MEIDKLLFEEDLSSGYRQRTIKNASADITIAFALFFSSSGEILTKNSVKKQNKIYIPIDAGNLVVSDDRVEKLLNFINRIEKDDITINIAGNSISTLKNRLTQKQCDDLVYEFLNKLINHKNFNKTISLIRSGGQSGFDLSGIRAAIRLKIEAYVLAPKNWKHRDISGIDIFDETSFKSRFFNIID